VSVAAERTGAIFCVDATQALGRCPVPIEGVDYLLSSSFKWLLGPHGLAVVYMSPDCRRRLGDPANIGWYSVRNVFSPDRFSSYELKNGARCLASGMPNFLSLYAMNESLAFLLDANPKTIFEELRPLVEQLRKGLEELGCDLLTPRQPEYASGVVAFRHPAADAIGAALARERIVVWGGDDRVRASVHLYNNGQDIARLLSALPAILNASKVQHV
jgi:selenocysteine lyase/cysteine desulfurase